jgi:hypothetical protein
MTLSWLIPAALLLASCARDPNGPREVGYEQTRIARVDDQDKAVEELLRVDSTGAIMKGQTLVGRFVPRGIVDPSGHVIVRVEEDGRIFGPDGKLLDIHFGENNELIGRVNTLRLGYLSKDAPNTTRPFFYRTGTENSDLAPEIGHVRIEPTSPGHVRAEVLLVALFVFKEATHESPPALAK